MTRRRKKVVPLRGMSWFGTIVVTIAAAMQALPPPTRLSLCRDLVRHIKRLESELLRHQRTVIVTETVKLDDG